MGTERRGAHSDIFRTSHQILCLQAEADDDTASDIPNKSHDGVNSCTAAVRQVNNIICDSCVTWHNCLSNAFDRLSNHFGFCLSVCVYVCPQIGCRTITSAILYWFSPNFACHSEIWLCRTLLFMRQTRSILPIFKLCKMPIFQLRDCGGHISHGSSEKPELRYN